MYAITQDFLDKMRADLRRVDAKVTIDYTDPEIDQSIAVTASDQANVSYPQQTADGVSQATYKWASLDGSWVLDGSYRLAPKPEDLAQYQFGWWSAQLAGTGGAFSSPYPTLTVTHLPRPIHSLRVVGDSARGEYPVDFRIDLYAQDGTLLRTETVTGNAAVEWSMVLPSPVLDVAKQVLTITKWSHPGRQAKIVEFFTSIQETYESGDVVEIRLLEEREASQGSLPVGNITANEITIRLANEGKKFDVTNRNSPLAGLLKPNRRIRAWLGVKGEGDGQTVTHVTTTQSDWSSGTLSGVVATATGDLELLSQLARTTIDFESGSNPFSSPAASMTIVSSPVHGGAKALQASTSNNVRAATYGPAVQRSANPWIEAWVYPRSGYTLTPLCGPALLVQPLVAGQYFDGYAAVIDPRNGTGSEAGFQIRKGGEAPDLLASDSAVTITPNQWYRVRLEVNGNTITARLWNAAGTLLSTLSVTDTTYQSGTFGIAFLDPAVFDDIEMGGLYVASGSRTSPILDLSPVGTAASSSISWAATTPAGTSVTVETRLSLDGGQTWGPWQQAANGGAIPGITAGMDLSRARLQTRVTLQTSDTTVTPKVHDLTIRVNHEEWVPLGTFWSLDWDSPDDTLEASVTARDRLELLRKSTYTPGQVQQNVSLYTLAEQVLQDAGLKPGEYWIDPALQQTVIPWAWLSPTSHREAMRIIAEAALAVVYADRDGVVRVEAMGSVPDTSVAEITADDYFPPLQAPSRQDQVANEIVVTTQPLRPADTPQEVYRSTTPINVPAGQTVTVLAQYNQAPVIEAVVSLDNPPAGVSIASTTYYAWGAEVSIRNTGTTAAGVTLVITGKPLSVQGGEQVVVRDQTSITENGVLRYEFPANPLVQTLAQAQAIANALLASAKDPRRDIEVEWRGNPAVELGDRVTVVGQDVHVIRQEITWTGSMSARLTGRKVT